jgi:hypothetical protein
MGIMRTEFEFDYRGRTLRVERQVLLPYWGAPAEEGAPRWHLSRLHRGILTIAALPDDTEASVAARFTSWLDERYHRFALGGIEYELYRIPHDFWNPIKDDPPPPSVWEVRRDGESVSQFPDHAAPDANAAIAAFERELAEQAFECLGGPLDGDRVGDRGSSFVALWDQDRDLDEDHARLHHRPHRGQYFRTERGYEWRGEQ